MRRSTLTLAILGILLATAVSANSSKLTFRGAAINPSVFSPANADGVKDSTTATIRYGCLSTDALAPYLVGDVPSGTARTFFIRFSLQIRQEGAVIRTLSGSHLIAPGSQYLVFQRKGNAWIPGPPIPGPHVHLVEVSVETTWSGRSDSGELVPDDPYEFFLSYASLIRRDVNTKSGKVMEKVVGSIANISAGTVVVDNTPPDLTIDAPVGGSYTNDPDVTVSGRIVESNLAAFTVQNQTPTVSGDSYTITLHLAADGSHTIVAKATDDAGNLAEKQVSIFLDRVAPELEITEPIEGLHTNAAELLVRGRVVEPHLVFVKVNDQLSIVQDGIFTATLALSGEGPITITVVAQDLATNSTTQQITVVRDVTPPIISNVSPQSGLWTKNLQEAMSATVTDAHLESVLLQGTPMAVAGDVYSGTVALSNEGANGPFVILTTDRAGNQTTFSTVVNRDTQPPILLITQPPSGDVVRTSTPTIALTFSDLGSGVSPSSLVLKLDDATITPAISNGTATFTVPSAQPLGPGQHTIEATISDAVGSTVTMTSSFVVDIGGDTTAPNLVVTPANEATITTDQPSIEIAYSDNLGVDTSSLQVSLDGETVTSYFSVGLHSASWTLPPSHKLQEGSHTLIVHIQDTSGNTAQEISVFIVDLPELPPDDNLMPFIGNLRVSRLRFCPAYNPYLAYEEDSYNKVFLQFRLSEKCEVRLQIYLPTGQVCEIRTYSNLPPGEHSITWLGKAPSGKFLDAGRYELRLTATDSYGNASEVTRVSVDIFY